jgi:hypothetical protein
MCNVYIKDVFFNIPRPKSAKHKDGDRLDTPGVDGDPGTLIADGTTDLGKEGKKKKGKKKKAKLSKSEKALVNIYRSLLSTLDSSIRCWTNSSKFRVHANFLLDLLFRLI